MQKNRRRLVLIAALIAFALGCVVTFLFHSRTSETFSFTPAEKNPQFAAGDMNWESLPPLPPQKPVELAPTATSTPTISATQFATPQPAPSHGWQTLSSRKVPLLTLQIGVVDLERVLAIHLPADGSEEARAKAISDIELATAVRASAHNCVIVLNSSGDSLNNIPVVLYSADPLDLTDEVIAQLGQ